MGEKLHIKDRSGKILTTLDVDQRTDPEVILNVLKQVVSIHAQLTSDRPAGGGNSSDEIVRSGPTEHNPLQESLRAIDDKLPEIVKRFYENLFDRLPDAKMIFQDIEIEAQHKKLESALTTLKLSFGRVESMSPLFEALARRHARYGVKPSHLEVFNDCLLETFATVAGDAWNDEAAAAWTRALQTVLTIMKTAMEDELKTDRNGGIDAPAA